MPITPIFVFDGPHSPQYKHGKYRPSTAPWMLINGLLEMLTSFKFDHMMVQYFSDNDRYIPC